ncbi:MAG: SemiSWEET transporter [Candidatus Woesearchaeota archaeon]
MTYIDIIGFLAGTFTTLALVPQAVKALKTKRTKDVSFGWILILTIGVSLWFTYGILINSFPIIIANGLTFILSLIVLILKIKYK